MHLKDKVAFVTGGASGIGEAFAKALVEHGAKVIIADINKTGGENLAERLNNEVGESCATFLRCDVSDGDSLRDAFQTAVTTFRHVDVMVNNAGILCEANWEKVLDVNLKGYIHGTEIALAHMRKDKGGQGGIIINTASMLGYYPEYAIPTYVASKHGVIGYTRSMASAPDIDKLGIRYGCICPELVDTPIFHNYQPTTCRAEYYEEALAIIAQEKISPRGIAEGLLSLIADDDSNGTLLHISLKNGQERKKITVENI